MVHMWLIFTKHFLVHILICHLYLHPSAVSRGHACNPPPEEVGPPRQPDRRLQRGRPAGHRLAPRLPTQERHTEVGSMTPVTGPIGYSGIC